MKTIKVIKLLNKQQ